jgi:hypothetical protein
MIYKIYLDIIFILKIKENLKILILLDQMFKKIALMDYVFGLKMGIHMRQLTD